MSDEDFLANSGFSPEEQRKAEVHSVMGRVWDSLESAFGSVRETVRSRAYDAMRVVGYEPHEIKTENPHTESDDVHVTHHHGEWHSHWFGGNMMEVHHNSRPDYPLDIIGVSEELHPEKRKENQDALAEWVRSEGANVKTNMLPHLEPRRRS
jgi:hypothetical protein